MADNKILIDDFIKLDLRVGRVPLMMRKLSS